MTSPCFPMETADLQNTSALLEYLRQFITQRRHERIREVLQHRTRYITLVMEDIFQSHNASAVLRTCDCMGIQDIHAIENRNKLQVNPEVALGSSKWLSIYRYNQPGNNNLEEVVKKLRTEGYRLVATSPHKDGVSLEEFDLNAGKTALLFGTELTGLSESLLSRADEYLTVPMVGFTESFNISVTAGIVLYTLGEKLRKSNINWRLSDNERLQLELDWVRGSIADGERLAQQFIDGGA